MTFKLCRMYNSYNVSIVLKNWEKNKNYNKNWLFSINTYSITHRTSWGFTEGNEFSLRESIRENIKGEYLGTILM